MRGAVAFVFVMACAGRQVFAAAPPPLYEHAAAYDPVGERLIVTGGLVTPTNTVLDEVWALSLGARAEWSLLGRLDSARCHHSLTVDPVRRRLILFGGDNTRREFGSVRAFDLAGTSGWSVLETTGGPIPPRGDHVAVYDPVGDRLIVHGGTDRLGSVVDFADTWCLWLNETPARWERITPAGGPGGRTSHAGAYDSRRHQLVLHSGRFAGATTWALSLDPPVRWTDITPARVLTDQDLRFSLDRQEAAACYDSLADRMLLFAGNLFETGGDVSDLWQLPLATGSDWQRIVPAGTPKARHQHAVVLDPVRARLLSVGGVVESGEQLLALDLPAAAEWSFQPPRVRLSPNEIRLPTATVGDTLTASLTVTNLGIEPLQVSGLEGGTPEFGAVQGSAPYMLDGWRQSHSDRFQFVARTPRQGLDSLYVLSNDPLEPRRALGVFTDVLPITLEARALGRPDTLPLGRAFVMVLRPDPGVHVRSATLYLRAAGTGAAFDSLAFTALSADLVTTVPAEAVTERGLEYFVVARNGDAVALEPAGAPAALAFQPVRPASTLSVSARPNAGSDIVEAAPVRVEVSLPLGTIAQGGVLRYRVGGTFEVRSLELLPTPAGAWEAEIPSADVGARGLEYQVAMRALADSLRAPASGGFTALAVRVQGLSEPSAHAAGRYRVLSMPLASVRADAGLHDILSSALGPYDRKRWRAFALESGESPGYHELSGPGDATFAPDTGRRAFWLITRDTHRLDTGPVPALSLDPSRPVRIPLVTGWNLIGDPFPFEIPWSQVQDQAGTVTDVRRFDPARGRTGDYVPGRPAGLAPFEGLFVRASAPTVLQVDPRPALAPMPQAAAPAAPLWSLALALHGESADDVGNLCGEAEAAGLDANAADRHEPPTAPGDWVRLAFVPLDAGMERLCTDLREPSAEGQVWELELTSARAGEVLRLASSRGSGLLPACALFDRERGVHVAMTPAATDSAAGAVVHEIVSRGAVPYRLALAAGTSAFVKNAFDGAAPGPEPFGLAAPSPNPLRLATWLGFTLPAPASVRLEVLDVTGRRVWSHASGPLPAGRHGVVWDARGPGGRVPPGIYLVRLTSAGRAVTRRLVILP